MRVATIDDPAAYCQCSIGADKSDANLFVGYFKKMFIGRLRNAIKVYNCIKAFGTDRGLSLNYASVTDKITSKVKIISGLEEKYRYDKTSDDFLQFDSSPVLGHGIVTEISDESLDLSWLNAPTNTNQECIQKFIHLANHLRKNATASITSNEYDSFIDQLTAHLSQFNENEVIAVLQIFSRIPFPIDQMKLGTRNVRELFMALDDNSARCAMDWDTDKRLAVCAIWSVIPLAKKSIFIKMVLNKFQCDMDLLSAKQFLAALFFINSFNHFIDCLAGFQRNVNRLIDEMTLEDIGLICHTFNRAKFRIHNSQLIDNILRRFVEGNVDEVNDISLNQLVKVSESS